MEIVNHFFELENAERILFSILIVAWFIIQYALLRREYNHRRDHMTQSFRNRFKSKKPHRKTHKA